MKPRRASALLVTLAMTLLVTGCAPRPAASPSVKQPADYAKWSVLDLKSGMDKKDFVLVNVHIPFEGRIAGTDREIPYDKILDQRSQLPADKNARIVLYCSTGSMSEIAAKALATDGYTGVVDVKGGMQAWKAAGYPLETKSGR